MYQPWKIGDKEGNIQYPKGEVVYQTKGIVIEPIYETLDGQRYIFDEEDGGKLLWVLTNPFNGYCYRQDGK